MATAALQADRRADRHLLNMLIRVVQLGNIPRRRAQLPLQHQRLGMELGPLKNYGSAMSQWVLTGTSDIMSIQTLRQLTPSERSIPVMLKQIKEFDEQTKNKYGSIMIIHTNKYLSSNVYPEHDDEPSNTDSREMENIYMPYEGYDDGYGTSTVP